MPTIIFVSVSRPPSAGEGSSGPCIGRVPLTYAQLDAATPGRATSFGATVEKRIAQALNVQGPRLHRAGPGITVGADGAVMQIVLPNALTPKLHVRIQISGIQNSGTHTHSRF